MIGLAARATASVVWLLAGRGATVPPDDQLGPVDQDPDVVREEACKLVSPDSRVCSPPKPREPRTSNGGGNFDLSFVSLLLWLLLIAAVVGLIYLLVRALAGSGTFGGRRRSRAKDDDDDELDVEERDAVAIDRSREPVNWRAEAEEHRRAGRYREALRCRYRALVGDLARRGLIDEIPGRTTGEERAQLRAVTPTAGPPFNAAADLFDGAWYGNRDVGLDDDDRFQSLERDVLASSRETRR
ncbi:MAG: DUF4129 domain-containing protein [Actinomycetota bacterium]|nr:DUF4129 domain-containing protein [Actinomycetota bacterium]